MELNQLVIEWAKQRDLLKPENHLKQYVKMVSEVGELGDALIKNQKEETIDAIGDVQVCLIILCEQLGLDMRECLMYAYNEICKRRGKTIDGTFIKEV